MSNCHCAIASTPTRARVHPANKSLLGDFRRSQNRSIEPSPQTRDGGSLSTPNSVTKWRRSLGSPNRWRGAASAAPLQSGDLGVRANTQVQNRVGGLAVVLVGVAVAQSERAGAGARPVGGHEIAQGRRREGEVAREAVPTDPANAVRPGRHASGDNALVGDDLPDGGGGRGHVVRDDEVDGDRAARVEVAGEANAVDRDVSVGADGRGTGTNTGGGPVGESAAGDGDGGDGADGERGKLLGQAHCSFSLERGFENEEAPVSPLAIRRPRRPDKAGGSLLSPTDFKDGRGGLPVRSWVLRERCECRP